MKATADTLFQPAFVLLWLYSLLTTAAWAALFPVLPLFIKGELNGGDVAVGIVMSGALLGAGLLQPIVGRIADRWGRRLLLVGGPLLFGSAVSLFSFADSPEMLFGLRALAGVGDAAFITGALTVVTDLAPDGRRGEAYSVFSLSTWIGMGLGPVVGDFVLRSHSFTAVWLVCASLAVAGAATAVALPETRLHLPTRPMSRPVNRSVPARFIRSASTLFNRSAAVPGTVLALEIFGFSALLVYAPLYAVELGMAGAGPVMLLNAAVLVTIRVFGRRLPDRLGPRGAASTGLAFAALGFALPAAIAHPGALYGGAASFGVGHALLYPALFVLAVDRASASERSAVIGSLKASEAVGMATGVSALGVVASLSGYGAVFWFASAATLIGLISLRVAGNGGRSTLPPSQLLNAGAHSKPKA